MDSRASSSLTDIADSSNSCLLHVKLNAQLYFVTIEASRQVKSAALPRQDPQRSDAIRYDNALCNPFLIPAHRSAGYVRLGDVDDQRDVFPRIRDG